MKQTQIFHALTAHTKETHFIPSDHRARAQFPGGSTKRWWHYIFLLSLKNCALSKKKLPPINSKGETFPRELACEYMMWCCVLYFAVMFIIVLGGGSVFTARRSLCDYLARALGWCCFCLHPLLDADEYRIKAAVPFATRRESG